MKKRLFSILLALCMVLCLVPTTAFAESETEEPPVCTCETACTAEAMNADCPICGAEGGTCQHTPGQRYGEQLCYLELREPTDAYEWSFVAVPAQRKAGVLKRYGHENQGMAQLRAQAELGRKYLRELRREVTRLAMLADDSMDGGALAKAAEHLEEPELLELKRVYGAQAARRFPPVPQLRSRGAAKTEDETEFLI